MNMKKIKKRSKIPYEEILSRKFKLLYVNKSLPIHFSVLIILDK